MTRSSRTRLPMPLLEDYLALTAIAWAVSLVGALAIATGLHIFADVTGSVWQYIGGVAVWFIGVTSGYLVYQHVPMLVAHGRTRRDAAEAVLIVMVAMTVVAAVLLTLGFVVEHVVYGMAGWPREITVDRLFADHTDVGPMLVDFTLRLAVWSVAGALVGAAAYRWEAAGWLTLLPAGLLVSLAGTESDLPIMGVGLNRLPGVDVPGVAVLAGLAIAGIAVALALIWAILRDIPLHRR